MAAMASTIGTALEPHMDHVVLSSHLILPLLPKDSCFLHDGSNWFKKQH
jgi:hypothetical protein